MALSTAQNSSELKFSFQFVNQSGKTKGFLAVPGILTQREIRLKDNTLRYSAIAHSTCRGRRLILTVDPQKISNPKIAKHLIHKNLLALEITSAKSKNLELFIDRVSSRYQADQRRRELIREGRGKEFRTVSCPHCESTLDLSLLNKTPYVYCRFCETIFQEKGRAETVGATYCHCDECGWFDRVQGYSEFYFYFFLIVYGFSWKRRYLCDTCVDQVFLKTLLLNFIFVLGIFPALWMKIKSLMGRDKRLQSLAKANALSKNDDHQQADLLYGNLHQHLPNHPGLLLNQGLGYLNSNSQKSWQLFQKAVDNCSNYGPAVRVMNQIQDGAQ